MKKPNSLWIHRLSDEIDVTECGEKAFNLSQMIADRLPIPPGVVVTKKAFDYFLDHNHLKEKITELVAISNHLDPESLKETSLQIEELITSGHVPTPIVEDLLFQRARLPEGPYMVRSSACGEDGVESSFAGQLESYQTEGTDEELIDSLKKCWASYWSDRVLFYQKSKSISLKGMGVVVQYMIRPQYAGVLFTLNPLNQNKDEMMVEYCYGHAERLVAGEINPGAFKIPRHTSTAILLHDPEQPEYKDQVIGLSGQEMWINELKKLALKLESQMGPCDIEWAVDSQDRLYLVQSRPITTTAQPQQKWIYWSNVNVNENYPRPITPMLYSIALQSFYHYFRDMGKSVGLRENRLLKYEWELKNIIGCHGARMYYNMTSIHTCLHALPFGNKLSSYFNNFVGDPKDTETSVIDKSEKRSFLIQLYELWRIKTVSLLTILSIPTKVASLEREIDEHLESSRKFPTIDERWQHFKELFHQFLFIRFLSWKKASLADTTAMMSYGLLGSFLKRYFKNSDELKNTLLQGIPNVVSSIPPQKIWELSQQIKSSNELRDLFKKEPDAIWHEISHNKSFSDFYQNFNQFLIHWGHRCSGELMLTEPNFQERPEGFIEILQGYLQIEIESPKKQIAHKSVERRLLIWKVSFTLFKKPWDLILWPFKVVIFQFLVAATAQGIRYRERVRLKQTMLYGTFRKTLLELNKFYKEEGLFTQDQDIFYLTYREVSELLTGASMFQEGLRDLITLRRDQFKKVSTYNPPDSFLLAEGQSFTPNCAFKLKASDQFDSEQNLKGLPACGGTKRGRARILNSALEAKKLQPGDILITKQTDPGWAPVFPLISALVIERGGMLSHGAIVAREFGIPAIVGVQGACQLITDGQEITVHGDTGVVELHD